MAFMALYFYAKCNYALGVFACHKSSLISGYILLFAFVNEKVYQLIANFYATLDYEKVDHVITNP